jgi:NAD(P)-dependent dehydrogenase (short-subunit alcohol dehydrogenase family)
MLTSAGSSSTRYAAGSAIIDGVTDVAVVCGAAGALGGALVHAFAERGDVVVAVVREAGRIELREGVIEEAADLADADSVEALWERLAAREIAPRWLVNAAGGFRPGTVADSEPDGVRLAHELNLGTAWWSCRAASRRLPEGGAIINVSSRAALQGSAGAAAYAVAKAGVVRLTEVLAAELAERRVRVNAILPAIIDTPQNRASLSPTRLAAAVPPEQLAAVAAFLCSDAAAAVTGAIVPAYGWA